MVCECINPSPRAVPPITPKIVKIAAVTLLVTAVALAAITLIIKYPAASTAFYSIFSITGALSFVMVAIHLVKRCSKNPRDSSRSESSDDEKGIEKPKPPQPNPFDKPKETETNPFENQ